MRRVVFLIPLLEVAGAERQVLRTAAALDRSRFAPTVLAVARGNGTLEPELAAAGVATVVLHEGKRPRLRQLVRLVRWFRRHPTDVLMTYMFHANLAGRLLRRWGIVPALVCSERTMGWDSWVRLLVNRWTVAWTDVLTVNSEASRRRWAADLGLPEGRISVIYNGIDAASYAAVRPSSPPQIGVLAKLRHPYNGHDWLLDALARLAELAPRPWACLFAGTGSGEAVLRARVADLRLEDRVRFLGHVADPCAFLRTLTLSVHPARYSGMPNAVLEAMACGLPVVGTAVGGTPEAIENGVTGWLVEPEDAEGTAALLADLLERPDLRRAVGERARARVKERFSIDTMACSTEEVLDRLIDDRQAGRQMEASPR